MIVAGLKGEKAPGVCSINEELFRAGGEAITCGLHAVLTATWQSDRVHDWNKGLVAPVWRGKWDRQDCNNFRGTMLHYTTYSVRLRLAHLLLMHIFGQLLKV